MYCSACPTVRSFSASSSGMSMSNSFSKAITSSTVSRLSAPRSSMKLASEVSLSRSTPSSSTMMSLTFSSSCFMSIAMGPLNGGVGKRSQHHPAVDDQHLTRNVAREVGHEKEHRRGHVRPLPQPAQRDRPDQGCPRVADDAARELRIDEPRGHGVHQHVAGGQLLGDGLGEADQAGLGRGVVRLPFVPVDAHYARDVDDPPPAPLDHAPGRVLGHEERALQIRVDHGIPIVLGDPEEQVVARGPGVAHVTSIAPRRAVGQRMRGGLRLGAVAPDDRHLRARHGEGLRDGVPDAAAPPRDDGYFAGQVNSHHWRQAASRKPATSSAVPREVTFAPGTMRRSSPASTVPGPASMKRASAPASSAARCMHVTHRTGAVSWSASRRRARVASRTGSAVALAITGNAGSRNGARSSASRMWFAAGAMSDEWNAPLTLRGTTRLAPRARHAAPACATAAGSVGASAPAAMYAEYSPSECPAAATAAPSTFGPTTANTAALCARIAGCAFSVAVSWCSGPSNISRLSAKPSVSSIAWSVCRASGNRWARSLAIPTFCAPCPGQSQIVWCAATTAPPGLPR